MRRLEFTPQSYRVSDFINWAASGALQLNPAFQRRPVWKPAQKSYFVDSLIRGYPVPQLVIRERVEINVQETIRDVVDGQQRLRTVIGFVRPSALDGYRPSRDDFVILEDHNAGLAGKGFDSLPDTVQKDILGFRFNVLILPSETDDREILRIFARMNATGVKLNSQELRNAEFTGPFKLNMYELALQQYERWKQWRIFTDDSIARMKEVELTSDLAQLMIKGISSGATTRLDALYREYENSFPAAPIVEERFQRVMDAIDDRYGRPLPKSEYRKLMHFYVLFALFYDIMYGLTSPLDHRKPKPPPIGVSDCLDRASDRFATKDVPTSVLRAMSGAATDQPRRLTRYKFLRRICLP